MRQKCYASRAALCLVGCGEAKRSGRGPIVYRIFPDFNLLVTRYVGEVTNSDFLAAYGAIAEDESRRPGMAELALLGELQSVDLELATLRAVSQAATRLHADRQMRTAVVYRKPMHLIFSHLYQSMAELGGTETVCQFEDLSEALAWIERPDFPPERLAEVPRA